MKIRMKTIVAGPEISARPEQILEVGVDITEKMAKAFIRGNYAELVSESMQTKTDQEIGPIVLDYGTHIGKSLSEVPDKYLLYLERLGRTDEMKAAAVAEIERRTMLAVSDKEEKEKEEDKEVEEKTESTSIETSENTSKTDARKKEKDRKNPDRKTDDRKS